MKIKQRVSLLLVLALMLGLLSGCGLVTPAPYPEAPVQNVEFTLVEDTPTPEAPAEAPAPAPALPGETALPEESPEPAASAPEEPPAQEQSLDEDGTYTTKEDLALYLHLYGHLPSNFVTKKEARAAGWTGGSVEAFFPGMCIGGDYYGDYEGNLPKAKGAASQYRAALKLFPKNDNGWDVPVEVCSARECFALDKVWQIIQDFVALTKGNGSFEKTRNEQLINIFYHWIEYTLHNRFYNNEATQARIEELIPMIQSKQISPYKAAAELAEG